MTRWAVGATAGLLLLGSVLIGAAAGAAVPGPASGVGVGAVGLAAAAKQAGFDGEGLRLAVGVGLAESGGDPAAVGRNPPTWRCPAGSLDRGGWQLNDCYHAEVPDACAYELGCAATHAYRISAGGTDWTAWTTYTSGAYLAELATADQAIAALATPGGCELTPAADTTRQLVIDLFGVSDVGGCDPDFHGHIDGSDHYPDANGQAHAIDVMVADDRTLGWQVARWAAGNAAALGVKYVIFAGQIIDFRTQQPAWHPCHDPSSSCATDHDRHVHISFFPNA